jgi:DNA-binding HxlR family transcriptional regulator
MQLTSLADWNCSIARTLDVIGEWWTVLIIRDAFRGTSRFDDFHASLGMARSVLSARLRKLTEQGVLERTAYSEHPPRHEYHLTDKGKALYPIIVSMLQWGDTWAQAPDGPPVVLVHDACGTVTHPVLTCPHCNTEVSPANAHSEPGPGRRRGHSGPAMAGASGRPLV